ncbi:MAG: uncharacterized protein BECKG1743D_GA0114223_112471 [Candidatus Kentron sp. G]|nr:MAG: uncharacterized protein BECKG1743F_GA0114225_111931 [Candidatus Kentron sp. G]VFN08031.1 MAG: uncharacterized protein BECKG1743D_GA0114223_112471 [Candidatus Kentron sp. G]
MLRNLPELIYPLQLARAGRSLCGRVTLARMHRLQPLLARMNTCGAEVALRFGPDDLGHLAIQGTIQADLNLICQRCLKAVPFRAESEVGLSLISMGDQANHPVEYVTPGFEPLMAVEDEALALSDIVEDELLLVLPMVPVHPEGTCSISERYLATNSLQDKQENPFSVLGSVDF